MKSPIEWIKELHTSSGKVFEHFPKLASVGESDVLAIQKDATRRPDEIISFLSSVIKSGELERDRLQAQVVQLKEEVERLARASSELHKEWEIVKPMIESLIKLNETRQDSDSR